ncbi:MAG: hypothetical protein ACP59X_01525 [Solidesulfovibrio sp. DCME]|uniref:hypothetical protein n=1 Tax=Solidesulfovibrio sp. DCME TaxID=3447380 RepID=UPI003D11122B
MRRLPRLCALAGLLGLLCCGGPAAALNLDPRPERAPVRLPDGLFAEIGPVDGLLRARLFTKKVKYSRVLETAPLAWEAAPGPQAGLALTTPRGGRGIAFGRFNEVAFDVRDADPGNPTLATLTVRTPGGRVFASDPLECVERLGSAYLESIAGRDAAVPVARAPWADKTPLYLARRLLDLPFDDTWRVSEDGPSTFLQRRFDRDALDLGAVDLVLRRPAPVQVNLVVALDPSRPRERTVLDWYALAKRTFELPDGRTVLRVYVGRYLRAQYPGLRAARLKEISLMFFRQGAAEVTRDKVVERLAFIPSGLAASVLAANGLPGRLPTRVREPFAGMRRVFVNVTPAAAALGQAPGATATADMALAPMAPGLPGGGSLESAALALVSPRRDTPAFLAAADELATSLGAAPDIDRADGGLTVTSLWRLGPPFEAVSGRRGLGGAGADTPVFLSGDQGLFQAQGGVRLYRAPSGLVVEGRAAQLAIPVTAFTRPGDGDLYFRLDIGPSPGLSAVFLDVAPAGGGAVKSYALRPGAPTPLPDAPAAATGAMLRFAFTGREFSLPLSRAELVSVPRGKAREGLYDARLPWPVTTAARAAGGDGKTPAFSPVTPFGRLSWLTTAFGLVGDPVAVSVNGGAPAVPDTRSGLLAGRLGEGGGQAVLTVTGVGGQAPGSLELAEAAFSGLAEANWREFFAAAPLVRLDGRDHAPGLVDAATARRIHEADDWLGLGAARLAAKGGSARFFAHPWYGVSALCFETQSGIDLARFAAPARSGPGGGGAGTLGRALAALAVLAAAVAGLRLAGGRLRGLAVRPARWLARVPQPGEERGRQLWWGLGACCALAAASFVLAGPTGRLAQGLAAVSLVPVWRAVGPGLGVRLGRRVAALGPWLAADPGRRYFLGFALSLFLAAGLRGLGLARLSEFCVQAGLYAFLAGLYLEVVPVRDAAGDCPRANTQPGDAP